MSMNIDSNLDSQNKFWNVCLDGELDVSTADKLKEHLHALIEKKYVRCKD